MPWKLLYKGFVVEGNNGQDECVVHFETPQFSWQTLHKNYRSAQICITKTLAEERMREVKAMYAQQQNNKEKQ